MQERGGRRRTLDARPSREPGSDRGSYRSPKRSGRRLLRLARRREVHGRAATRASGRWREQAESGRLRDVAHWAALERARTTTSRCRNGLRLTSPLPEDAIGDARRGWRGLHTIRSRRGLIRRSARVCRWRAAARRSAAPRAHRSHRAVDVLRDGLRTPATRRGCARRRRASAPFSGVGAALDARGFPGRVIVTLPSTAMRTLSSKAIATAAGTPTS